MQITNSQTLTRVSVNNVTRTELEALTAINSVKTRKKYVDRPPSCTLICASLTFTMTYDS